jgi:Domain of unknown function (DUF222)
LKDGHDGRSEVEHGPTIPIETARRLACDASLVSVVENDAGEPLNVGRKTRSIPPALRRALSARDSGCREFLNNEGRPYQGTYREVAPAHDWKEIQSVNEARGIYTDSRTAVTRWTGERMDYDLALFCLFGQRDREHSVSAETSG